MHVKVNSIYLGFFFIKWKVKINLTILKFFNNLYIYIYCFFFFFNLKITIFLARVSPMYCNLNQNKKETVHLKYFILRNKRKIIKYGSCSIRINIRLRININNMSNKMNFSKILGKSIICMYCICLELSLYLTYSSFL